MGELVAERLDRRVARGGFVRDGFSRSLDQATIPGGVDVSRPGTLPIARAYAERGLQREVEGNGDSNEVFLRLQAGLGNV